MSTPNAPQKMFLFFSNYCEHSKRLLNRIKSSSLVNNFNMVSIDDQNINLPNFIESVPTIYDPVQRQVMTNETLFNWVEGALSSQSSSNGGKDVIDMEDITGSSDIMAFQQTEMIGGAGGTSYSFIEDNDNDNLNHHYEYLDSRDNNNMVKFTKASDNSSLNNSQGKTGKTGNSATNSAYDKMMADRQQEMQSSMPAMRL